VSLKKKEKLKKLVVAIRVIRALHQRFRKHQSMVLSYSFSTLFLLLLFSLIHLLIISYKLTTLDFSSFLSPLNYAVDVCGWFSIDRRITAGSDGSVWGMESGKGIKRIDIFKLEKRMWMINGKESRHRVQSGRWSCGCCGKVVRVNSILCIECNKLCHHRCSGLK